MATLIHMISKTGSSLRVAAYYPVPPAIYDESSIDMTRVPISNKLTTQEVNDVKSGLLYEVIQDIDVSGMDEASVKLYLEQRYTQGQQAAANKYRREFSDYVGEAWDGSTWS